MYYICCLELFNRVLPDKNITFTILQVFKRRVTHITLTSFPDVVSELNCDSSFTSTLTRCDSLVSTLFSLFSLFVSLLSFVVIVVDDIVTHDVVVLSTDVVVAVVDVNTGSVVKHILDVAAELKGVAEVVTIVVGAVVEIPDVVVVVVVVVVDVAAELF